MKATINPTSRPRIVKAVLDAPDGYYVDIREPTRSLAQNRLFHDLCGDIAKSGFIWMGKPRTAANWKVLLISGHGIVTGQGAEVVAGLEGELVNIRESSASMGIKRANSLIEYTQAFAAMNDVKLPMREYIE